MFLLDTNVISELRKSSANPNVTDWANRVDGSQFYLSVITLLEVERGALRVARRDPVQGAIFRDWIDLQLIAGFSGRFLPIDEAIALKCAALHVPNPRPERDAMIAATALVHDLTFVTRNVNDFRPMGVGLLNPWDAA